MTGTPATVVCLADAKATRSTAQQASVPLTAALAAAPAAAVGRALARPVFTR